MSHPVYKIETYTGAVLDHTIEKDAVSIYTKEVVTSGVGHFNFVVPTKKNGSNYYYDDIALGDKIKIWFGYDSVSGNPDFVGKVARISAPLSTQSGYIRIISGLSQGEVLLRRLKRNKYWEGVGASTIVTELANDLGLGTGQIAADASSVDLQITKGLTYLDVLMKISDYWVSAGSQVKKDFYVNYNNDLVWKARPIRTTGVETFTVGKDIINYEVVRDVFSVKNQIYAYGNQGVIGIPGIEGRTEPTDKDTWTIDAVGNWTVDLGTVNVQTGPPAPKAGSNELEGYMNHLVNGGPSRDCQFRRDLTGYDPIGFGTGAYRTLNFWFMSGAPNCNYYVRLYAPDSSNYFEHQLTGWTDGSWELYQLKLGRNQEYDATFNPDAPWTETGSPTWWDIQWLTFYCLAPGLAYMWLDGLYFGHGRFRDTASDATSQSNYGQRDLEVVDDKLESDSECQTRSETILYQKKDPPIQIQITVPGNTNVLVGDRLSMTIPAEGISAANYDVFSVEHSLSDRGFVTSPTMVNSANIRQTVGTSVLQAIINNQQLLRQFAGDERRT